MKDGLVLSLLGLALVLGSMAVVGAVFDRDYWRAVASLTALQLLTLAVYPYVKKLTTKR